MRSRPSPGTGIPAAASTRQAGRVEAPKLAGYEVGELIATLPFSVVYRARQAGLARMVRVKALKATVGLSSPYARQLEREAKILGAMQHEGVLRLYELVRTPEALALVLEDVGGHSLEEVLARARVGIESATAVALGIARGLAHAHERGVAHGALGAPGVWLTPDGGVVLVDFSAASAPRLGLAAAGVEGTLGVEPADCLAPEQAAGGGPSARADVFSFGLLLFELCSGTRPFGRAEGAEATSGRRAEALPLGEVAPDVPRSLERIAARCLARDPADRFSAAGPLALALEAALLERTAATPRSLVVRALASARLGDEPPEALSTGAASFPALDPAGAGPPLSRVFWSLALVLGAMLAGGALFALQREQEPEPGAGVAPERSPAWAVDSKDRGYLRVLARPWADVYVDGEAVDTTPVARPIPVAPGQHFVTFRHPNAPDEQRTIKVAGGQTVLLDVTLRVDRGGPDAGTRRDAGRDESP